MREIAPQQLTVAEAAEVLRVSPHTIRRRIAGSELKAVRTGVGPRTPLRIDRDQLNKFIYGGSGADDASS